MAKYPKHLRTVGCRFCSVRRLPDRIAYHEWSIHGVVR